MVLSNDPVVTASSSALAARAVAANRAVHAMLGGAAAPAGLLDMLLLLLAEDEGAGVTTSRCCAIVDVPRTTALRWITTLVASGTVDQREDARDRRITRLSLTPAGRDGIARWLAAMFHR